MDCRATLDDGVLVLANSQIRRTYRWNGSNLVSLRIEDLVRGHGWDLARQNVGRASERGDGDGPDFGVEAASFSGSLGALSVTEQTATPVAPAHLRVEVTTRLDGAEVMRAFRIYPDCPAIACDLYIRGQNAPWLESLALERLALPGTHWCARVVEFLDVTDRNNTLVHERSLLPYRYQQRLVGNLLFLDEVLHDRGLFVLKEAPGSSSQLAYPGYDFVVETGEMQLVGSGLCIGDLDPDTWIRAYGWVTGVTGDGELGRLQALRSYQECIRIHEPGRDEMVLMNTWGDRGQDTRLGEAFALAELEAGTRLGISHLQLDDGWQAGRSSNSAFAGGSLDRIWDTVDYWVPHPERFPRGLGPVVQRGGELGVEVCVWFNPSKDDSYAHWRDDAETLIRLYRTYGIRTFKIDGVQVPDKRAEVNLRRMLDTVCAATNAEAVFNLDVTAGQRYGYHFFNEYGNTFVENRYTDWSNYYPHWTLRNLWMLSRYVPPQNLQMEFLNVWRNADRYAADDLLAPAHVPFDYVFATTMMAQPLAWFEATGLPEVAFDIAGLVRSYREHQVHIHAGRIFPIGEEPSGTGWTGFQSIRDDGGYVLVFRELNERRSAGLRLFGLAGRRVELSHVLGYGENLSVDIGADGEVVFPLPGPHTFALYEYQFQDEKGGVV